MFFGVLGSLLVRDDDVEVCVGSAKLRVLLAALLVHANEPVFSAELAGLVWGERVPDRAEETVRTYVMRVRRTLGPAGGSRIVTKERGYCIQVAADEFDVTCFTALCEDGSVAFRARDWPKTMVTLARALALWRGSPLAEVPSERLRDAEVPRLEHLRLQAQQWCIEAGLRLGRGREFVPELQTLTADHPLDENLHAQLMLALAQSGRRSEALAAYQRVRGSLVAELGIELNPGLQRLHQRILAHDRDLFHGGSGDDHAPQALSGPRNGTAPVPRQLPTAVPHFTGRAAELTALTRQLDEAAGPAAAPVIFAIRGMPGIGKTALAVHWAHQVADRFPDGQLYINLRGFGPCPNPVAPGEALEDFLTSLGVAAEAIPLTLEARAGLYRSLLAGRRMLVVLDNARDSQQVRSLLPGGASCFVLVTSRDELAGLAAAEGAAQCVLDVFTGGQARQFLGKRLKPGVAAREPGAVAEISRLCSGLPLALSIMAARAATRPALPLSALAQELRDASDLLGALDAGDESADVRTALAWSYRLLGTPAARMFRVLGWHPGPDVSVPAAASLAAVPLEQARSLLRELTRAHLVTEHAPGRFALHDLVRAYARALARSCDEGPAPSGRLTKAASGVEPFGKKGLDAGHGAATGRLLALAAAERLGDEVAQGDARRSMGLHHS